MPNLSSGMFLGTCMSSVTLQWQEHTSLKGKQEMSVHQCTVWRSGNSKQLIPFSSSLKTLLQGWLPNIDVKLKNYVDLLKFGCQIWRAENLELRLTCWVRYQIILIQRYLKCLQFLHVAMISPMVNNNNFTPEKILRQLKYRRTMCLSRTETLPKLKSWNKSQLILMHFLCSTGISNPL